MTKQQRKQIDDLYIYSNNMADKEKEEKKKAKEREKRIKQRKNEQKDQFDFDTETVIGMTNKNNQKIKQKNQEKITKKQAKILKKKKKIKRIIKTIILLALIIGGFCFALISPIFNVTEINVTGNEQYPAPCPLYCQGRN